jgi:hypothetical protein
MPKADMQAGCEIMGCDIEQLCQHVVSRCFALRQQQMHRCYSVGKQAYAIG